MPDRENDRHRAQVCVAAAESIRDPQQRAAMLAIAKLFMKMADYVGARHNRATAHRSAGDEHPENDS